MNQLDLELPSDIPWKRLAATEDMFQKEMYLSKYPPKWRSSISIYYYEPSEVDVPDEINQPEPSISSVIATEIERTWRIRLVRLRMPGYLKRFYQDTTCNQCSFNFQRSGRFTCFNIDSLLC